MSVQTQPTKLINMWMPPNLGMKLRNNSGYTHVTFTITLYNCWLAFLFTFNSQPLSFSFFNTSHITVIIVSWSVGTMSIRGVYKAVVADLGLKACSWASLVLNPSNSVVCGHTHYAFKLFSFTVYIVSYSRCCRCFESQTFVVGTRHSKIVQALYHIFLPNSNAQRDLQRCWLIGHLTCVNIPN